MLTGPSVGTRLTAISTTVAGVATLITVSACGRSCHDSSMELTATTPTSTAITASARLSSDGTGVSGKRVSFLVDSDGSLGQGGNVLGYARTDVRGTARLEVNDLNRIVLPGNRITGLRAKFSELGGSEAYCDAEASTSP